jgi:hypothetical protein
MYETAIEAMVRRFPSASLSAALGPLPDNGIIANPRVEFKHRSGPNFANIVVQLSTLLGAASAPEEVTSAIFETLDAIAHQPASVFDQLLRCFAFVFHCVAA